MTDIILCFNTAIEDDNGFYKTSRKVIACTYLKGWFTLDFFTTIPF